MEHGVRGEEREGGRREGLELARVHHLVTDPGLGSGWTARIYWLVASPVCQ